MMVLFVLAGCSESTVAKPEKKEADEAGHVVVYHPREATNVAIKVKLNDQDVCTLAEASSFKTPATAGINRITITSPSFTGKSDISINAVSGQHYFIRVTQNKHLLGVADTGPFNVESVGEELAKSELATLPTHSCQ